MLIDLKLLVDALNTVEPALADKDTLPILTNVYLDGRRVLAYNDRIALSAPLDLDLGGVGSVPGKTLLQMLSHVRVKKEVEVWEEQLHLRIKAGGANIKLPMAAADFPFVMPDVPKDQPLIKSREVFVQAIEDCLQSVNTRKGNYKPEQMGITIVPNDTFLDLYATDDATITHTKIKDETLARRFKARVILSTEFCRQMLRLSKPGKDDEGKLREKKLRLIIHRDYAMFLADDVILYGRLIANDNPVDIGAMVNKHISKNLDKLIDIPAALTRVLDRAKLITKEDNDHRTVIKGSKEVLRFESMVSGRGEVIDSLKVPGHPDINVAIRADRMRAGIDRYERFLITERSAIMARDDTVYLMSCKPVK